MAPTGGARRRSLLLAACTPLLAPAGLRATSPLPGLQAPNVVPISGQLVTAGQPDAASLERLGALGFGAVIYLAPPTVHDAVPGEAETVRRQGLDFTNIPVPFDAPTAAHLREFSATLARLGPQRKCLVHCQVNMRASSFTFLHRVIVGRESPEPAYEAVARVWSPNRTWKRWLVAELRAAGIGFEPY
jgi:protein tyrosine phosphatase (PTP) superfamily phosphohydrolase (DUF442 family)